MSELRVNKVTPRSGTTVTLGDSGDSVAIPTGVGFNGFGYRNRIINGDMRIDQRNAGVSVTPTANVYTLDRWYALVGSASKMSFQQSTTTATGFSNSALATTVTAYSVSATDTFAFLQPIEGFNVADLGFGTANAKTVTLSFWVRSSLTGTFGGALSNNGYNRSYPFTYTISTADTFEYKTITIAGDTSGTWTKDNSAGLRVYLGLGVGATYSGTAGAWSGAFYASATGATSVVGTSGATFYITGVQLEAGTTASDFEFLPVDVNLRRCQRYFYKIESTGVADNNNITTGYTYGTGGVQSNVKMEVTMRSTPSFSYDIGANGLVLYNNVDSITASVPKVYAFAPFGGLLYFDSDLSGTFGASHRPVNVSFNTTPSQTKVLKFSAEL